MDLLALVADQRCVACAAPGRLLCAACRRALPWLGPPGCLRCGAAAAVAPCPTCAGLDPALAWVRAAVALQGPARDAVRAWKDQARAPVGRLAARCIAAAVSPPVPGSVLVPVPAAPERAAWRGVDGPADLARRLGRRWGLAVRDDVLVRRDERPQRGRGAAARRRLAGAAYAACGAAPRRCVLVDDVMTTGATLAACAARLAGAGAIEVGAVTFARVVTESQWTGLPVGGSEEYGGPKESTTRRSPR